MPPIDLRQCLNAISDVVNNRPRPIREFDQIYMKTADMLLQTEHAGRSFRDRDVVFVGDGDAIGLCLLHLHNLGLLESAPKHVHVLDFDERIVNSVRSFAKRFAIADRVSAELYNVADPLPEAHWRRFDGFYTNPPFGASNGGTSVEAFLTRGFEAVGAGATGCVVIADSPTYPWTQTVLRSTEGFILRHGFLVAEVLPEFHHYHLDDAPDLTSCSIVIRRIDTAESPYASHPLDANALARFYGEESPLRYRYVRDLTNGAKLGSRDYRLEPLGGPGEDHG